MIQKLEDALASDPMRKQAADNAQALAETVASRIPLVHRTGKGGPWRNIFNSEQLCGGFPKDEPEKKIEREYLKSLNAEKATYFFWGCGAYPNGNIALILDAVPEESNSSITPFDSGGCAGGYFLCSGHEMSEKERVEMLDKHTFIEGTSVARYGADYLAAHFRDPMDYVSRPQTSVPDHKPYHGLESETEDRRAWSIEVRVHDDVPVPPKELSGVVLQSRDLFGELPTPYRRLARVVSRDDSFDFCQGIGKTLVNFMEMEE